MVRNLDAEYRWWMDQLQEAIDKQTASLNDSSPEQTEDVQARIRMIRARILDILKIVTDPDQK